MNNSLGASFVLSERPRFERGSFSGRSFDEGPPSPRREYSRSMSSDNWREAKREAGGSAGGGGGGGGGATEEEEGDWRRAGPKDRWSRFFFSFKFNFLNIVASSSLNTDFIKSFSML